MRPVKSLHRSENVILRESFSTKTTVAESINGSRRARPRIDIYLINSIYNPDSSIGYSCTGNIHPTITYSNNNYPAIRGYSAAAAGIIIIIRIIRYPLVGPARANRRPPCFSRARLRIRTSCRILLTCDMPEPPRPNFAARAPE